MRVYRTFSWKDTNLRIASEAFDLVTNAVVAERRKLEHYIARHPEFRTALVPVVLLDDAPEVAHRMAAAADRTGLGPMASVAGTLAQAGAEAAMAAGCREAIVENGGDMYVHSDATVTIALYAGDNSIGTRLAFRISPRDLPLALCSSSARMGHSLSFGRCDLATVTAREGALADSAVTLACNLIRSEHDLAPVLDDVGSIPGVIGIFAVHSGKIGMWGHLPDLVRNEDGTTRAKITRDVRSGFVG
ncbi:UPF0280 family protein [Desulfobulbus alkaliphilus]|uniref:UPF0280 family protein n=1 Tax=Desulfobulbus alkaliphilus TaxID=869814 RepID=UPI0019663C36|nr:UPF0280 family protein [Desulfobulbus alkaliphilus]MBM9536798.1 UPF0280 family protein [Desulfobulbus alkaliphilus]